MGEHTRPGYWRTCPICHPIKQHPDPYVGIAYTAPCPTLRILATVYADHPDYREEWKP